MAFTVLSSKPPVFGRYIIFFVDHETFQPLYYKINIWNSVYIKLSKETHFQVFIYVDPKINFLLHNVFGLCSEESGGQQDFRSEKGLL